MPRDQITLRIDSELIQQLKQEAQAENRNFNNYVETLLLNRKPDEKEG